MSARLTLPLLMVLCQRCAAALGLDSAAIREDKSIASAIVRCAGAQHKFI